MADKKFLGLGFTFAAQDKGLEKKLKSIHTLTKAIGEDLGVINVAANSAGKAMAKLKMPAASKSTSSAGTAKKASTTATKVSMPPPGPANYEAITKRMDAMHATLKGLKGRGGGGGMGTGRTRTLSGASIESMMGPKGLEKQLGGTLSALKGLSRELQDEFINSFQTMDLQVTGTGKDIQLTSASLNRLGEELKGFNKINEGVAKTSNVKIKAVFENIKDYVKTLGGSVKNFLSTVGLDLDKLIPPQLAALGGVGAALLSPLKGLGGKKEDKLAKKQSKQIGGKGIGKSNLYDAISGVESAIKNPPKKGIMGRLMDWLKKFGSKPFGLIGAALGGLMKMPFKGVGLGLGLLWKGLKYLVSLIPGVGKAWEFLSGLLEGGAETFEGLFGSVGSAIAEIAVFGAAIFGAVKGIIGTADEWKNFFGGIWSLFKSVIGFTGKVLDAATGIEGFSSFLISLPMKLLKMIADGWEQIFGWLGIGAGKLGNAFKGVASFLDKFSFSKKEPDTSMSAPGPRGLNDTSSRSTEMQAAAAAETNMKLDRLVDLQEEHNQHLKTLNDTTKDAANNRPNINMNLDTKKLMKVQDANMRRDTGAAGVQSG